VNCIILPLLCQQKFIAYADIATLPLINNKNYKDKGAEKGGLISC